MDANIAVASTGARAIRCQAFMSCFLVMMDEPDETMQEAHQMLIVLIVQGGGVARRSRRKFDIG